jgi:hypothetical protein
VENVLHESPATDAILRRMEEVRCDVDEDVQEIVEGARDMGKWRYYVKNYPWVCLGAALAAGYLIVPRRSVGMQPDAQKVEDLVKPSPLLETTTSSLTSNVVAIVLPLVGNLVMRGVAAYVGQQADKLFASETVRPSRDHQP